MGASWIYCHSGYYEILFLLTTSLSQSWTLGGISESTRRPSRALNLATYEASGANQNYKETVRCAALNAKVPEGRQVQLTQTLTACL